MLLVEAMKRDLRVNIFGFAFKKCAWFNSNFAFCFETMADFMWFVPNRLCKKIVRQCFFFHKKIMNKSRNLSICFDSFRMLVCSWQKKKWHLNKAYWRELSVILPAHVRKIASIIAHYNHKFDMGFCLTKQLNSLSERLGLLPVKHGLLGHTIEVWGIWPVP